MNRTVPLLDVQHLQMSFQNKGVTVDALRGVSLQIECGQSIGVVGASGSGKSTLARCILQLIPYQGGHVLFEGVDLGGLSPKELRLMRSKFQMVFQDPGSSLNQYMRAGDIIAEPLKIHTPERGKVLNKHVHALLNQVGLLSNDAQKYPHEFSGGQKQRIAIARSLALNPSLLLCDEPTSALDVSVQAKILNLLADLKEANQLTLMLISHDLAVVNQCCDSVVVMDQGKIVEEGCVETVIQSPAHDMTKSLIESS